MAGLPPLSSPENAATLIMAWFGNLVVSGVADRRAAGFSPGGEHHETGLPVSASDLLPRFKALGGRELAMRSYLVPTAFAAGLLSRTVKNAEGDVEEHVSLATIPENQRTQDEQERIAYGTRLVQLACMRLAQGDMRWVDVRPPGPEGESVLPFNEEGLPMAVKVTHRGLEEAISLVRRRPELRWRDPKADFGHAVWSATPQWARDPDTAKGLPITVGA